MKLLLLSLILVGSAAFADDQEVVVTATKQPTDPLLLTVPVEVTDPSAYPTLRDALSDLPGVKTQETSPGEKTLSAVGFGENGFGRVNLLVDGISQNTPDMSGAPLNLVPIEAVDHIETLSASASALYGDQSVTGAVNVVTKVPTKTTFVVDGSVEDPLNNTQALFFGTPLPFGGLLVSAQRDQDLPTRDRSQSTEWNLWSKLLVDPAKDQHLTFTGSYFTGTYQLPGSLTQVQEQSNPDLSTKPSDNYTQGTASGAAQWDWSSSLARLTTPASFSYRTINSDTPSSPYFVKSSLVQSEVEPRVSLTLPQTLGGDLTLGGALGAGWQQLDFHRYNDEADTSLAVEALLDRTRGAGWLSVQENWNDTWVVSAEARAEVSVTTAHSDQDQVINNSQTFVPLVWSTGVAWIPLEGSKVALNLGRTFRYPFLDEMVMFTNYAGYTDSFNTSLVPETGYDATLSGETKIGFLRAVLRGTLLRMDNEILSDPVTYANTNEAASLHSTVDASVQADLGPVNLSGEYTFERAVFVEGPFNGDFLTLVPAHTLKGAVRWSPVPVLSFGSDIKFVSSYYQGGDYTNSLAQVGSRVLIGAEADLKVPALAQADWTWTIYGKNLTDDRTPDFVYWGGWYPTEGRTFGTELKVKF